MGLKLYPETAVINLANAIRSAYGGISTSYRVSDMASAILNIPAGEDNFSVLASVVDGTITEFSYSNQAISVITSWTFYDCRLLERVDCPSITEIQDQAFQSCYSLSSISFPLCSYIGSYAFAFCSNLTAACFPSCVSISTAAFTNCNKISSLSFPLCTIIGSNAFYAIGSGVKSITSEVFPICTTIGSAAFYLCHGLSYVYFPEVTQMLGNTFGGCSSLSTAVFPLCTKIDDSFRGCSHLTSVSLPLCEIVGYQAFYYCSYRLSSISLPACYSIGSNAFAEAYRLSIIDLGSNNLSVNSGVIGASAFRSCRSLLSLYLRYSFTISLSNINAFTSTPISNYTASTSGVYGSIYVPSSLYDTYITATNWATYSSRFVSI